MSPIQMLRAITSMRVFKLAVILNYIFWGGMATYALGELLLRNAWFQLFTIERTIPNEITINQIDDKTIEIKYSFSTDGIAYEGERRVYKPIAEERLPTTREEIEISYNSLIPQVNFIDELGMKSRTGYVGLTISGIFLTFVLLIDIFANKQNG